MIKFYIWFSLGVMAVGLAKESTEMVVFGFLTNQLWMATEEIIKAIKNDKPQRSI